MKKLLIAAAIVFSAPAMAQYKCTVNGKTTYSDAPCAAVSSSARQARNNEVEDSPLEKMNAKELQAHFEQEMAKERAEKKRIADQEKAEAAARAAQAERVAQRDAEKAAELKKQKSSFDAGQWIARNQSLIKQRLRDPDSARFDRTHVSWKSGSPVVCGYVNAKNAFGGYVGRARFIAAGEAIQVLESDMAAGEMSQLWYQSCDSL